jgi:pseudooxynicotine oxidase
VRDVIVVGGGFAGVTAARECALRGLSVLLLEARERLGGRTWNTAWDGHRIEYGGAWVHWHQPHTFSEVTRAGLSLTAGEDAARAVWHVDGRRRFGTIDERDVIAQRGWDRFVDGVRAALPQPHAPLIAIERLAPFDRLTIAERVDQLELDAEEREVLSAELESLAHAPLTEAGAVSVLRWHALSGHSLRLTQETGGKLTIVGGTVALLSAIAGAAPFEQRLGAPVAAIEERGETVSVTLRDGSAEQARAVVVAVPLNALGAIEFAPGLGEDRDRAIALGQASRGIKLMLRVRGDEVRHNAIRPGHAFGYLDSQELDGDGTQLMIGFGPDAERCDATDHAALQRQLEEILPGYVVVDATAHDWLADEFSRGTWAIHRPGWYEHHHAAMRRLDGRVVLAGSDLADGWAGFIDGAIESGLRAGARATAISG